MEHKALVIELEKLPEIQRAYTVLRDELPRSLVYHNLMHTRDVLSEALLFAITDKLPKREIELLAVAAAFHDTGFSAQGAENETISADLAQETLEKTGQYKAGEIAIVRRLILDTTLTLVEGTPRQCPGSPLAGYLLDADMANLGRADFFEKAELIFKERKGRSKVAFARNLLLLLQAHTWHTSAARSLRDRQKQQNLAELKRRFESEKAY